MEGKIIVIGSSNTDMVIKTTKIPSPGETVLGGTFFMNAGGKGANQAVAAARLGGEVTLICKLGNDIFGKQALESFKKEHINTDYIFIDGEHPSGMALITVDERGENCIVVAPGANGSLEPHDMEEVEDYILEASVILLQLEIPLATVSYVVELAQNNEIPVILNPAPACELPVELLRRVQLITPNKLEAAKLSGIPVTDSRSAESAARELFNRGVETVIITMGAEGALLMTQEVVAHIPGYAVSAVDTTAAGDIFNAALAVALGESRPLPESVDWACRAAALSVTKLGAQASAPYRHEVNAPGLFSS